MVFFFYKSINLFFKEHPDLFFLKSNKMQVECNLSVSIWREIYEEKGQDACACQAEIWSLINSGLEKVLNSKVFDLSIPMIKSNKDNIPSIIIQIKAQLSSLYNDAFQIVKEVFEQYFTFCLFFRKQLLKNTSKRDKWKQIEAKDADFERLFPQQQKRLLETCETYLIPQSESKLVHGNCRAQRQRISRDAQELTKRSVSKK